jgi:putative phosphoribosyl transferase
MQFRDRRDAGRRLACELANTTGADPVVVALPRGGVPVAFEVAGALNAPLEILAVRKLGAPGNPELGVGALAEDGTGVVDQRSAARLGVTEAALDATLARESAELRRRVERYRDGRSAVPLEGRDVIVVDDGLATGLTDLSAVRALRKRRARSIVVAVPVGSPEAIEMLHEEADRVVCVMVPERLMGVGMWYQDFSPVPDEEVEALLARAAAGFEAAAAQPASPRRAGGAA